jgi:hypothetical protein
MVLNHTRVPWPRFIDGTCLPLKQLGFEGSLIQSKGVIFRRSMLNIVVVVVHARVEWHPSLDPPCIDTFTVAD